MKHIFSYCELRAFKDSTEKFTIFGANMATRKVEKHVGTAVYVAHAATMKVFTGCHSLMCAPLQRFLTTSLPYPIETVPLENMFWVRACDVSVGMKIAIAPRGPVAPVNIYTPQELGHNLRWDVVTRVCATSDLEYYGVAVEGCDTYVINNILIRSYDKA